MSILDLGFYSGGPDPVWSCAKWLDTAKIGTIIRNQCTIRCKLDRGIWFVKMASPFTSTGTEWRLYDPATGKVEQGWHVEQGPIIEARDIFLPVQVMTPEQVAKALAGEQE